jgi:serine/threonine protein kinase
MLTCEDCGKLHPAGTSTCDVCGSTLTAWPYVANSDLGQELGLDRLPPGSELGRVLAEPLRELTGALCAFCQSTNRPGATFCAHCGHALIAPPAGPAAPAEGIGQLPTGALLQDRYRILGRVAQGGMGAVYEALDEQDGGLHVAVKEMAHTSVAPEDRTQALKDFMREATLLATLDHPNLPHFYGVFTEEGKYYLVMEFIEGHTLEQVVSGTTAFLPESRVLIWAAQLCDVLAYLHRQDPPIIYRDTKPGNIILLDSEDHVKLIDFGIARFHRQGRSTDTAAFGTAGYAPPEQYGNGQTDQRSDVYALAATLHHLLSGHDPVQNPFHWRPIRSYNPHVSRQVDQAIMRALELKPELRFPGIDEFARALGLRPVLVPAAEPATAALPREAAANLPAPSSMPTTPVGPSDLPPTEEAERRSVRSRRRTPREAPVPVPAAPPGLAPASKEAPALAASTTVAAPPAEGPQLSIAETVIDLGIAGRKARKGRVVNLLNAGQGQLKGIVHVTQPWLAVSQVQFQGNVGELSVGAKREGLQLGHAVLRVPNVFAWAWATGGRMVGRWVFLALIALMIWGGTQLGMRPTDALLNGVAGFVGVLAAVQIWLWLVARHVRWFVPAPLMNQGTVIIDSNGGQRRLEVRVLARPSWVRRALAWFVLTVLLIGELVAALLGLFALLSGM